jgi:hypothetical protein
VGLVVLYRGVRARDLRPSLVFGLVAALSLAPFYVRNFYYTGNPVWPFLGPIFGYGTWSPADYQANLSSMRLYGMGTDLIAFLSVPWNLVFNASEFGGPALITPIHLLLALILPFAFKPRSDSLLASFFLVPLIFWFFSAQDARYLLPILPLGCVILARSMDRSIAWMPSSGGRIAPVIAYCLLSIAVLRFGVGFAATKINGYGLPPVTSTERRDYLSLHLTGYSAVRWLNENVGTARTYRLFGENLNYYFDGPVIGDHFGLARYSDVTRAMTSGELLYTRLKTFGVTHFFVLTRPDLALPNDASFTSRFRQIYADDPVLIYELVDPTAIK